MDATHGPTHELTLVAGEWSRKECYRQATPPPPFGNQRIVRYCPRSARCQALDVISLRRPFREVKEQGHVERDHDPIRYC